MGSFSNGLSIETKKFEKTDSAFGAVDEVLYTVPTGRVADVYITNLYSSTGNAVAAVVKRTNSSAGMPSSEFVIKSVSNGATFVEWPKPDKTHTACIRVFPSDQIVMRRTNNTSQELYMKFNVEEYYSEG